MIIIRNFQDKEKQIETLAKEFNGIVYIFTNSIQIEFDSDYAHMEQSLVTALIRMSNEFEITY